MSKLYPCVYCTEDGYCKKYSDEEVTSWCVQGPCKDEKPSNADRIRSMTDEKLAKWIAGDVLNLTGGSLAMATEAWLDWLKAEVSDGKD